MERANLRPIRTDFAKSKRLPVSRVRARRSLIPALVVPGRPRHRPLLIGEVQPVHPAKKGGRLIAAQHGGAPTIMENDDTAITVVAPGKSQIVFAVVHLRTPVRHPPPPPERSRRRHRLIDSGAPVRLKRRMKKDHRSVVRRSRAPRSVSRPVSSPIHTSVVYASDDADQLDDQYEGRAEGYTYSREGHPNATIVSEKIDWLEGMDESWGGGVLAASGMGAVSTVLLALLRRGDHIVAGDQLYGRSLRLMRDDLPRMGFEATLADPTDAAAVAAAIRPKTRLILVELVSNPTLRVADIEGIAQVAKERGVLLVVDNTFTTPRSFRPYEHGADVVIHSLTKLLAGHSDAMLGYASARTAEMNKALYDTAVTWGFAPSPFDCWLAERGIATFELRYDRAEENAAALADALAEVEGVKLVLYPGRPDHPDHNRAGALLDGRFGNMVSFTLDGGRERVNRFLRAAEHIAFAPTLGDVGTTMSHPASSSHRGLSEQERLSLGIEEGFIRLSVGVEDFAQLSEEIIRAIRA